MNGQLHVMDFGEQGQQKQPSNKLEDFSRMKCDQVLQRFVTMVETIDATNWTIYQYGQKPNMEQPIIIRATATLKNHELKSLFETKDGTISSLVRFTFHSARSIKAQFDAKQKRGEEMETWEDECNSLMKTLDQKKQFMFLAQFTVNGDKRTIIKNIPILKLQPAASPSPPPRKASEVNIGSQAFVDPQLLAILEEIQRLHSNNNDVQVDGRNGKQEFFDGK